MYINKSTNKYIEKGIKTMKFNNDYTENPHSTRRRRNIDLTGGKKDEVGELATGIDWDRNSIKQQDDLEDDYLIDSESDELDETEEDEYLDLDDDECDYEEVEIDTDVEDNEYEIDDTEYETEESIDLDDIDLEEIKIGNRKLDVDRFQEAKDEIVNQRITIYLPKSLILIMDILKEKKMVKSYSSLLTDALTEFLSE